MVTKKKNPNMKKKKHMTDMEKTKCLAWIQENVKQKEVAKRLKVSLSSVKRLVAKSKQLSENILPSRKPGSGRPKKVTDIAIKTIKKAISKDPRLTGKEIKDQHPKHLNNISLRTIRRVLLEELGLKSHVAAKKPYLTKIMKKKRLLFAKQYLKWTEKQWENCLFTDESIFCTSRNTGQRVRRKTGEGRFDEKYTKKTFKHSPSIMIWTCFSGKGGPGDIFFLKPKTKITSSVYVKVLESHLTKTMRRQKVGVFFQDRATPHTAARSMNYLRTHGLKTIFFPSSSPDLNPIEHGFSFLKRLLDKENTSSIPQLKKAILKHWKKLGRDYFLRLSHSMPQRLKEIVKNKGAMTKY